MKVQFLGTGSAINTSSIGSSLLVEDCILIDVPGGLNSRLRGLSVDIQNIEAIAITHLHGDHIFGLPFVLLEYMLEPRSKELLLMGPAGLEDRVFELTELAFPKAETKELLAGARCVFATVEDGTERDLGVASVKSKLVPHGLMETYGLIITSEEGRRLLYAPDVEMGPVVEQLVEQVDVAILDATSDRTTVPGHMSLEELCTVARSHPSVRIYATHRGRYRDMPELPDNVLLPEEEEIVVV